jgi:hypothetical protein
MSSKELANVSPTICYAAHVECSTPFYETLINSEGAIK